MITQFISIGLIALMGAMLPGPDFALVVKNSLFHSRKAGVFTTFGVCAAVLFHMTYCVFGLVLVIAHSAVLFNSIRIAGALYLGYLGVRFLLSSKSQKLFPPRAQHKKTQLSNFGAFRQGFLCNILNPKATLFFFSLFTLVIKPETPFGWEVVYGLEIVAISLIWFCSLTVILSHRRVKSFLEKAEKYIAKFLGVFLLGFGAAMLFVRR